MRLSDLTQALDRIDRLQVKIDVRPPVLTYSKASRKLLFLADRAFLFFRRNGDPRWPWMAASQISVDLSGGDPLLLDLDI